jgi:hypothetical protein
MKVFRFLKEDDKWFIDLPQFIESGGNKADLQMVEGADTMLDLMAEKKNEVSLRLSQDEFKGADKLDLKERCDPSVGGGYYIMDVYEGRKLDLLMWLCGVTEWVFGELPERIFVKRVTDGETE